MTQNGYALMKTGEVQYAQNARLIFHSNDLTGRVKELRRDQKFQAAERNFVLTSFRNN